MDDKYFDEIWANFFDEKPLRIMPSEHGSGDFGAWSLDTDGNPCYRYMMDHQTDPRAAYRTSRGPARDHWHLVGNERLIATAHNNGHVQVYDWSRGGKCLNRWAPETGHLSGGFSELTLAGDSCRTLWEHLPKDAEMSRIFGEGYFDKITRWRGVTLTERVSAPMNGSPVLLCDAWLENTTPAPLKTTLTTCWDVNLHQITPAPLMTHGLAGWYERRRARINENFSVKTTWDETLLCARVDFQSETITNGNPDARSMVDHFPKSVFLAALDEQADAAACTFAGGNLGALCIARTLTLPPATRIHFRCAYGVGRAAEIPGLLDASRSPATPPAAQRLELHTPGLPWLTREMHWHSYYLQAGALYSDYYASHFVDQGSAYSFLQGLSGAPRDFALFTVPMVYLRPDLAKDMLRFAFRSQCPKNGKFPYAHVGYGLQRGYLLHSYSSDLDLFNLWALAEYVAATQDHAFWREELPYYPKESGKSGTVLEHAKAAFAHLRDVVGLGAHGLIRSRSGDWNDVLMAYSGMPLLTFQRGESSLNAGLATLALPMLADAVQAEDAPFAAELRAYAEQQKKALRPMMGREYVARGYLGYRGKKLGDNRLFLDAQGFGVIGGVWDTEEAKDLFEVIYRDCAAPQKVGALALWPPMKGLFLDPGSDTNGGTWAAIDGWTAWAWSLCDPARAWDFFLSSTLAARAEAYPETWYGIWSGPDSYNAHYHPRANETFLLNFTPMTDYPVMNMNRHACPLLAAIKMAGIRTEAGAISIEPNIPLKAFSLRTPLLSVAYKGRSIRGCYTPVCKALFRFRIKLPDAAAEPTLRLNGETTAPIISTDGFLHFEAHGKTGQRITWEIQ